MVILEIFLVVIIEIILLVFGVALIMDILMDFKIYKIFKKKEEKFEQTYRLLTDDLKREATHDRNDG